MISAVEAGLPAYMDFHHRKLVKEGYRPRPFSYAVRRPVTHGGRGARRGHQETEKHKTFDLLDALSKSGALAIDDASLHIVVAATHRFDKTLIDTVIQDNVNPVEKVERSLMIDANFLRE